MPMVMPVPGSDAAADSELVAQLRAGDRAALEEAYRAHHVAIRGFARRLVGDPVPEGTVRTRLYHAKRKLREKLELHERGGDS